MSELEKTNGDQSIDPNWTVYATPLTAILQTAEQMGIDQEKLLSSVEVKIGHLNIPERRFPVAQYFRLYQAVADATGNPDIGLAVGRIIVLKGMNLQLYVARVSTLLRDYLNLIPSLLKLRGDIGQINAYRHEQLVELRWEPLLKDTGRKRFFSDEMLSAAAAIINSLCVLEVPIVKAHFTYEKPDNDAQLIKIFGKDILFKQAYSSLFFDVKALNYPILQQDYHEGPDHDQPFRVWFEHEEPKDLLLSSLKQSILQQLPEGNVTIDKLANKLNVSRRTLQRRLADRDTNFLSVLQKIRSSLAVRYLSDRRLGISEIAFLLGYADQGSFSSAFKNWHGISPKDYRGC